MDVEMFSCYCLFDICCLAKVENESFKQMGHRAGQFMKNRNRKGRFWLLNRRLMPQDKSKKVYCL